MSATLEKREKGKRIKEGAVAPVDSSWLIVGSHKEKG